MTRALEALSPEAKACLLRGLPALERALEALASRDRQLFQLRLARGFQNLYDALEPLYGARDDFESFIGRLLLNLA